MGLHGSKSSTKQEKHQSEKTVYRMIEDLVSYISHRVLVFTTKIYKNIVLKVNLPINKWSKKNEVCLKIHQ